MDLNDKFQEYFKEIRSKYLTGDYTEGTLRTPFENFIKSLSNDFQLIQEPSRVQKLGTPDFKAFRKSVKVGYIETKDLGKNLDNEIESEQIKRYKESVNNIILTDYSRFILIRDSQKIFDLSLFNLSDLGNRKFSISEDKINEFLKLIDTFFSHKLSTIKSAKELAKELSKKAKLLKELAKEQLEEDLSEEETNGSKSSVYDFYEGLKELIRDIDVDDCADAYAQTITYGLFLAKITQDKRNSEAEFSIQTAALYIPKNVGVIRRIFINISNDVQSNSFAWIIDDVVDILNATDINRILSKGDVRGRKDPYIYFYEDFLEFYDPEKRKHSGEYSTPRPVVSFIVNVMHQILKKDFGKVRGFADDEVTVLDPCVGTGTFLWITFLVSFNELTKGGLGGLIKNKIENHILKHFYGFEISIVSYIISHIKLTALLDDFHYTLKEHERIQVYLTNTLEPSETHGLLPFMRELSEESIKAGRIKKKSILAIFGNPPYFGMSANKGKWIDDLLKKGYMRNDGTKDDGYYKVDGKPIGEKNPKWLQDDYVKFIRFAQWKIDKAGEGMVGFITNHSYLDNPTFRGMRESLIDSFDRIYILNLHGNIKKKEKCPDGSKDENVFDIQQGVAIAFFIKNNKYEDKKVFYADLWGTRSFKYDWLDELGLGCPEKWLDIIEWKELKIKKPYYYFVPRDYSLEGEYEKYWKITDVFPVNSVGIVTARDSFVIDFDKETLKRRIKTFRDEKISNDYIRQNFELKDKKNWKLEEVRRALKNKENWENSVTQILYRPFDTRWIFYDDLLIERSRKEVMRHMIKENLGLITVRQVAEGVFNHAYVTDTIIESRITLSNKGIAFLFPLYLYSDSKKKPNIPTELFEELKDRYGKEPSPEEIFYYIYSILHSNKYRERYAEFLESDFPHIPFTKEYDKFKKLSEIGKKLVNLHLTKIELKTKTKFDVEGSNIVEVVKYKDNKIYINKAQSFDGVPEDTWNFYIGGYKVLDKWLKSRKKRELSSKEIERFIQIVEIINQTIMYMKKIDEIKFL